MADCRVSLQSANDSADYDGHECRSLEICEATAAIHKLFAGPIDPANDGLLYCVDWRSASSSRCQRKKRTQSTMSPSSQSATVAGRQFAWRIVAVLWIVLCGGFVGRADASCGDYLHHNSHGAIVDTDVSTPSNSVPVNAERSTNRHGSSPICSGPACRRSPESPTRSIPVGDGGANVERLALLSDPAFVGTAESARLRPGNPFVDLEEHRRDLDRPPRSH